MLRMIQESSCVTAALILFGGLAAVDRSVRAGWGGNSLSETPACRHSGFCNLVGEDGMRQAALLRLDKGLGTPGTDRKKAKPAKASVVSPARDDRNDHFVVRNGVRCAGVHLIIDLYEA